MHLGKKIGSKNRHVTPEIPVFFVLHGFKKASDFNVLFPCNSEHVHNLN